MIEYKSDNFKIDACGMNSMITIPLDVKRQTALKKKLFNGLVKGLEREGVVLHDEPLRAEGKVKIKI